MSILVDEKTRLITQGITGREGMYHTEQSMKYGTRVVGGVTPGKGGQKVLGNVPVFNTVRDAVVKTKANATMVFVPPPFAADAILAHRADGVGLESYEKMVRRSMGKALRISLRSKRLGNAFLGGDLRTEAMMRIRSCSAKPSRRSTTSGNDSARFSPTSSISDMGAAPVPP